VHRRENPRPEFATKETNERRKEAPFIHKEVEPEAASGSINRGSDYRISLLSLKFHSGAALPLNRCITLDQQPGVLSFPHSFHEYYSHFILTLESLSIRVI